MKKNPRFVALPVILFLPILLSAADLRLIDAVRRGDRNAVRELLRNHIDVNVAQPRPRPRHLPRSLMAPLLLHLHRTR